MVETAAGGPTSATDHDGAAGSGTVPAASSRRRWQLWRSPADQPAWARPALLGLAALAGFVYAWRAGSELEIYYAAAVRSMSASWHDFFYGAFDPAGTITIDKLPGAFWLQALSVRLFGLSARALVWPQAAEGVVTVLVFYRAVRRLAGPVAGIGACALLVAAPATATLDRGNISDTLMVLLLVVAADFVVTAVVSSRPSALLWAGGFVGLAFQAKMLEAWLVLPALALVALVAGPGSLWRRCWFVAAMGAVAIVVSLSWMTAVTLTPANERPYVDGSQDNSVYAQVFVYNGFGRVDEESPDELLSRSIGLAPPAPRRAVAAAGPSGAVSAAGQQPPDEQPARSGAAGSGGPAVSPDRLLTGSLGRDTGWLVPAALVALVAGLVARRRRPRTDPVRAGLLLWGGWLLAMGAVFSVTSTINSYYTAALSPPIAGLVATGLVLAWRERVHPAARLTAAAGVLLTSGYAWHLLPDGGTGLPSWLRPAALVVGIAAAALLVLSLWWPGRAGLVRAGLVGAVVAGGLVPAVATVSVVADRLGAFDTPFQPPGVTAAIRRFFVATPAAATTTLPTIERARHGARYLMAVETSAVAAPFIYATGLEVLPIGGFTGTIPSPTLPRLRSLIADDDFHLELQSPGATDPRLVFIAHHCIDLGVKRAAGPGPALHFAIYYCLPASLGHAAPSP